MSKSDLGVYADHTISSLAELEENYGPANPASLVKEIDYISDHYRAFIEKSPFVVLATVGPDGVDCSPRGDPPGFVRVLDERTVAIPDRRGNNRIDNLRNLVVDPRASLLFLIPGIGETIRINGRGYIVTEPELRASFEKKNMQPATVVVTEIDEVYTQCAKAILRAAIWSGEDESAAVPTAGQFIKEMKADFDADSYDTGYAEYARPRMW